MEILQLYLLFNESTNLHHDVILTSMWKFLRCEVVFEEVSFYVTRLGQNKSRLN